MLSLTSVFAGLSKQGPQERAGERTPAGLGWPFLPQGCTAQFAASTGFYKGAGSALGRSLKHHVRVWTDNSPPIDPL
jgi:hypothetical protein